MNSDKNEQRLASTGTSYLPGHCLIET